MYQTKRLDVLRQRIDEMLFNFETEEMSYKNTDQIREDLQKDIDVFLSKGGEIEFLETQECTKANGWREAHDIRTREIFRRRDEDAAKRKDTKTTKA